MLVKFGALWRDTGATMQRWHRRTGRSALVALLISVLMVGTSCTGSSPGSDGPGGQVKLRFSLWSSNKEHLAMMRGFADEFHASHPKVTVELVPVISSDYLQKISTSLAGGNPFDAGWLGEGDVSQFVAGGVLADLGPALTKTSDYDLADFSGKSMRSWRSGEKVYGVPFSTSPFLIYYNKDLLAKAGAKTPAELAAQGAWTWEKLRETAKAIRDKAGPSVYGFQGQDGALYDDVTSFWNTVVPAIRAYGGSIWDPAAAKCQLTDPGTAQAVGLLQQMVVTDKSMVPPGEQSDFFAGQAGMTINQLSRASMLADAPFKWGIAPLPSGPAGKPSFYGQAGVVVFQASKHADVAADFVAFLTSRKNVETMAKFFPPARESVLGGASFRSSNAAIGTAGMELVAEQVRAGESFPFPERFADINLALKPKLDKLWAPGADVRALLKDACAVSEPLLGHS